VEQKVYQVHALRQRKKISQQQGQSEGPRQQKVGAQRSRRSLQKVNFLLVFLTSSGPKIAGAPAADLATEETPDVITTEEAVAGLEAPAEGLADTRAPALDQTPPRENPTGGKTAEMTAVMIAEMTGVMTGVMIVRTTVETIVKMIGEMIVRMTVRMFVRMIIRTIAAGEATIVILNAVGAATIVIAGIGIGVARAEITIDLGRLRHAEDATVGTV
jgi:hypothetical protein